jgi:hypothetical protein
VKNVLLAVDNQGMSGIIATLEPDHEIRITGQQINDFALAFITPLGTDHYHTGHVLSTLYSLKAHEPLADQNGDFSSKPV